MKPLKHLDPVRQFLSWKNINKEFLDFVDNLKVDHQISESVPEDFIVKYYQLNSKGETIESTGNFEAYLCGRLSQAVEEVRSTITQYHVHELTEISTKENYVELQIKYLQNHINAEEEIILKFPSILDYLKKIEQELNLILPQTAKSSNSTHLDLDTLPFAAVPFSTEKIINAIFSFYQGRNEQGEKIMPDNHYRIMMTYIEEMVNSEEKPTVVKRLHPKLDNAIVSFSFWVLHRELYTTKKIRTYFFEFMQDAFVNFDETSLSSLKSSFARKPKLLQKNIPPILEKYWFI